MAKKRFKRIAAAICAGMVMSIGTAGISPISAEDAPAEEVTEEKSDHDKAAELTASMETRQKIAQMIMLNIRYWNDSTGAETDEEQPGEEQNDGEQNGDEQTEPTEPSPQTALSEQMAALIGQYDFGGVLLYADNMSGTEQTTRFTAQLQEAASKDPDSIPLLIAADQEGGSAVALGTGTDTCGNMALGATGDPDAAYDNAMLIGEELKAVGINTDFAPVMDINSPKNPVIGLRSFSSEPELVKDMGLSFLQGLNENSIIGTVKHFPGNGDTDSDSRTGLPLIDRSYDELKERELIPFQTAFENGADMVMAAHIQCPQIESGTYTSISSGEEVCLPATLSRTILTEIVRGDMGYEGVIVTDGMQTEALTQHFDVYDTAVLAINAGADLLLEPVVTWSPEGIEALETYLDRIEEAVADGTIPESRIDESCTRILELKYKRGLFEENPDDVDTRVENALHIVGSEEHHSKEMEIAKKAITLVQNNDSLLPLHLDEEERVAFFYPEESVRNAFVYAFDQMKADGTIPENAAAEYNSYEERSAEEFREMLEGVKAVVISAETWNENDMDPEQSQKAKFIDEMIGLAHSMDQKVVVLSMALPYDTARYTAADAVLAGYGSMRMPVIPEEYNGELATYGPNYPAAVMTVFGANEPTGKLPVNVNKTDDSHHFTDETLYEAGYGLTYSDGSDESSEESSQDEGSSGNQNTNTSKKKTGAPKTGVAGPILPIGIAAVSAAVMAVSGKRRKQD